MRAARGEPQHGATGHCVGWREVHPTGQQCGAERAPQSPFCGQYLCLVWKRRSAGSPPPMAAQPSDRSPVPSPGLWAQFPAEGSGCSFGFPSPAEPSGPTPCTAAATCAGSPAGSRQGTRSQASPAALGPLTWKASCCSPPPPRSLSAKVRGARAIRLSIHALLRQGSRRHGASGCLLPRARQSDALSLGDSSIASVELPCGGGGLGCWMSLYLTGGTSLVTEQARGCPIAWRTAPWRGRLCGCPQTDTSPSLPALRAISAPPVPQAHPP